MIDFDFDGLDTPADGAAAHASEQFQSPTPECSRRAEEAALSRSRIAEAAAAGGCWHRVLGVGAEASVEEVRRAFRELALLHHPDKQPTGGEDVTFKHAQKAYEEGLKVAQASTANGREKVASQTKSTLLTGSLVTASFDHTVKIWAARTGQCKKTIRGHKDHVHCVALSPDGKKIVTGAMDRTLKIWDLSTYECVDAIDQGDRGIRMLQPAFSPDGKHLLAVSLDDVARVWSLETGQCVVTFKGHRGQVHSACFANGGQLVVTGSADKTARIWSVRNSTHLRSLGGNMDGHVREIVTVSAPAEGDLVATGSKDKSVKVWRWSDGACLQTLVGHDDYVISSSVHPNGDYVASGSDDCSARVWDVATGECVWHWTGLGYVNSIYFSPDGARAITATYDRLARVWNIGTGKCERTLKGHEGVVSCAIFAP